MRKLIQMNKKLLVISCTLLLGLNLPMAFSAPTQASGNKYAVVFGVAFKGDGASGTDNTARLAAWLLIHEYGFLPENVKLLINEGVTYESMTQAVSWLVSVADESSTAIFIYSGHGSMSSDKTIGYIATYQGSYSSNNLKTAFTTLRSQKILIVIDACYSGAWISPMAGSNRIVVSSAYFNYAFDGNHYTNFGACFFDLAIRKGKGDANGDGFVSVEEARNYRVIGVWDDQYLGDMFL